MIKVLDRHNGRVCNARADSRRNIASIGYIGIHNVIQRPVANADYIDGRGIDFVDYTSRSDNRHATVFALPSPIGLLYQTSGNCHFDCRPALHFLRGGSVIKFVISTRTENDGSKHHRC